MLRYTSWQEIAKQTITVLPVMYAVTVFQETAMINAKSTGIRNRRAPEAKLLLQLSTVLEQR